MQLPEAFNTFFDRICLGPKQNDRIESAAGGLKTFLAGAYGVPETDIFLQGSYPNGTAVKPEDADNGEYDVDLVCTVGDTDASPTAALDELENKLADNGNYAPRLRGKDSSKTPCVRLFYADDEIGGFHVDVVPARPSQADDPQAPLEVPRRDDGWYVTAPREYTAWCRDRGERFARTVKMLKRWRDYQQDARKSIKSIVLQVLAAQNLGTQGSDAEALVSTLAAIKEALSQYEQEPPRIENPVLASENLAERWTSDAYRDFLKHLDAALDLAQRALAESDVASCHDLWRDLLGEDFPKYEPGKDAGARGVAVATPPPGHQRVQQAPTHRRHGR